MMLCSSVSAILFLSTPSARRATLAPTLRSIFGPISIHALREEGDTVPKQQKIERGKFLSTPSARRATAGESVRRTYLWISIHALREEGDIWTSIIFLRQIISIHALREEGDQSNGRKIWASTKFLSTPSARRATKRGKKHENKIHISIHALREEGDPYNGSIFTKSFEISIHALREEGDNGTGGAGRKPTNFYPRPPRGGRLG